jgi:hypothetical protein
MANETYNMKTLERIIKLVIAMIGIAFPGENVKIGVLQGGRVFIDPWYIEVVLPDRTMTERGRFYSFRSGPPISVQIYPGTVLDQVDHGGVVTAVEYATAIAARIFDLAAGRCDKPEALLAEIRGKMSHYVKGKLLTVNGEDVTPGGLILPN